MATLAHLLRQMLSDGVFFAIIINHFAFIVAAVYVSPGYGAVSEQFNYGILLPIFIVCELQTGIIIKNTNGLRILEWRLCIEMHSNIMQ